MTVIELEDILYPGIVTLLAVMQLKNFADRCGRSRDYYKVYLPRMIGHPDFERTLRAQQNTIEFFPIFMGSLWMSSIFFNQVITAIVGLVYVYSREKYFIGYMNNVHDRLPGYLLGCKCLRLMKWMAAWGFVLTLLRMYLGIDINLNLFRRFLGIVDSKSPNDLFTLSFEL